MDFSSDLIQLFDGITHVPIYGCPGTIVIYGKKAHALFSAQTSGDVILAIAKYGNGRVFVGAHDNYVRWLTNDGNDSCKKAFMVNVKKWLCKQDEPIGNDNILDINQISDTDFNLNDYKIVKWRQDTEVSEDIQMMVLNYVKDGGALICGVTPWGFLQLNDGCTLNDLCLYRFLKDHMDMILTDRAIGLPEKANVSDNLSQYSNFNDVLEKLTEKSDLNSLSHYCNTLECGIEAIRNLGILNNETLVQINQFITSECDKNKLDPFPRDDHPIKVDSEKSVSKLLCRYMIEMNTCKAPYISNFPGDFKEPPILVDVKVELDAKFAERLSTGYYSPAGTQMCVQIIEGDIGGWLIRIGAHTDDISGCEKYDRWPFLTSTKCLEDDLKFCSPFGGLVYFDSPDKGNLVVRLRNVVEAPYFDKTKPETVENWNEQRKSAPGLWGEICGEHVIITSPSDCLRELENPMEAVEFWDKVVKMHHELRGTNPYDYRRERVVNDKQLSAGYMHAGYPIVTHLDMCDSNCDEFIYDVNKLKKDGSWGLFHEFGHNMQRDEWTFEGSSEVTVNLFSMHAMEFVIGKGVLEQTWVAKTSKEEEFKKYFAKNPTYNDWKSNYYMALMVFVQLIKHFGWDPMKKFMRDYENDITASNNLPRGNQDKIDQWVIRYSKIIGKNIKPQFQMWGLPVSNKVDSIVANLPEWCPLDEKDPKVFFKQVEN